MTRSKANYAVTACDNEKCIIRDKGPWGQHLTVTNDAEAVVLELIDQGYVGPNTKLFYYDSDGQLDEIKHDGEKFTGFAPGPR